MKVIDIRKAPPEPAFESVIVELTYKEAQLIYELAYSHETGDNYACGNGTGIGGSVISRQFQNLGVVRRHG